MADALKIPPEPPEQALGSYARLSSPRLIGREEEFALVLKAVLSRPSVVLIEGEAGVGKTRLIHELLTDSRLSGHRKLVGHSDPLDEPLPMEPVIHALASLDDIPTDRLSPLAGALRPLVPELSDRLPPAPDALQDPRAERHRLLRALAEVLSALGPTVLTLEDVHWADNATLEFLSYLTSHQPPELSLVCTYRREELHNIGVSTGLLSQTALQTLPVQVSLVPLKPAEVGMLVSSILGIDDVSSEFVNYLHEKTAGLPLAVEEVLRLLQERNDVLLKEGRWARRTLDALEVPVVVRDSILERVSRLPAPARAVVEAAAVIGAPATEELLAVVARAASVVEGLSDALISGLLEEKVSDRYDFRHALARQAVYDAVSIPRRRRMHLATADALAADQPHSHARIAHHYRETGAQPQWMHHAEAAADRAAQIHDYASACRFLEEVLRFQTDPGDTGRIALKLGTAALEGMQQHRVAAVLEEALDQGLEGDLAGQVRLLLALLLAQDGKADRAYAEAQRVLQDLSDVRARVRAMILLAMPLVTSGTRTQHLSWLLRAQEEAQVADDRVRAALCFNTAATMLTLGDPSGLDLLQHLPALNAVDRRRQLLRGNLVLAFSAAYVGRYVDADHWLSEHLSLTTTTKDDRLSTGTESTALLLDFAMGRWQDLEQRARLVSDEVAGVPCSWVDAQVVLGQVLVAKGRTRDAEDVLRAVIPVARRAGLIPHFAAASAAMARLLAARGAIKKSYDEAVAVVEILRTKDIFMWGAEIWDPLLEVVLGTGDIEGTETLVSELEVALAGLDAPAAQAAAMWGRARIARARGHRDAAALFTAAQERWDSLPRPYDAARVQAEHALLLLERGHRSAEAVAMQALEFFVSLGAEWDAARVRRTMRAHGVGLPRPWRGGRKGYGDKLSPRESEIAGLAAEGRTNKEIAALLFLSPRTVENHLSAAMRKLDARSRRELGDRLERASEN